jgi:hypothetical protein
MLPTLLTSRLRLRSLSCLLALALFVAQLASLLHKLDVDIHPAGEVCAICVVMGHTDSALPAVPFVAPLPQSSFTPFFTQTFTPRAQLSWIHRARGPPVFA